MRQLFPILFLFLPGLLMAQEKDYYRLPKERKMVDGRITLPNLQTEDIFWYLNLSGGMKLQSSRFTNNYEGQLISLDPGKMYWEAAIGMNRQDKWQFELGYMRNPIRLEWRTFDRSNRLIPFFFSASINDHGLLATYKRRLFTIDRVTKRTRLNILAGIKVNPLAADETIQEFNIRYPTLPGRQGFRDTLSIQTDFISTKPSIAGVVGLELMGRVADPIEVGLFGKIMLDQKGILSSNIAIESTLGSAKESQLLLNATNWLLGFSLRWNFHHGIHYTTEKP
ncbi:hypothetical protein [Jiulongibacter sediminis]|jgi:hypothetical protein|uniref:hypothetical protein n=1 Tax=Jiulongibacter sediminis TaxID=1605367 RepID=UPI0026EB6E1D|nr:hypothetical protein [Jiulongibacter sediminis]